MSAVLLLFPSYNGEVETILADDLALFLFSEIQEKRSALLHFVLHLGWQKPTPSHANVYLVSTVKCRHQVVDYTERCKLVAAFQLLLHMSALRLQLPQSLCFAFRVLCGRGNAGKTREMSKQVWISTS